MLQLYRQYRKGFDGLLLEELHRRILGDYSPSILIDGIWLSQSSVGGISRVWQNILSTFSLPGLCRYNRPLYYINRSKSSLVNSPISVFNADLIDPFDTSALMLAASENSNFVSKCSADVFCSSWITTSGSSKPVCPEVAVVHDCIPEHFTSHDSMLPLLRKRWVTGSSACLSVSSDTSTDLSHLYDLAPINSFWCHLAPHTSFFQSNDFLSDSLFLQSLFLKVGLSSPFIVLPGSGLAGSYKNPQLLGQVLMDASLSSLNLLITGINSGAVRDSLIELYPALSNRIFVGGFSDGELSSVYRSSLAVVLPSLIEGFGLPVVEVMASGGIPLIADVRGLREAGSEAALRFNPYDKSQLIAYLQMLCHSPSRQWISSILSYRNFRRLHRLNPDLFGLSLLTVCRSVLNY